MKTISRNICKSILAATGKVLTLCGVAITFAACYGSPPHDPTAPDYWAEKNDTEEMLFGADAVNREKYAETPAVPESQSEQPVLLQGE